MKEEKGMKKAWQIFKWMAREIINRKGYGHRKVWFIGISGINQREVNRFVYVWYTLPRLWNVNIPMCIRVN
jgi:hypothetical protein